MFQRALSFGKVDVPSKHWGAEGLDGGQEKKQTHGSLYTQLASILWNRFGTQIDFGSSQPCYCGEVFVLCLWGSEIALLLLPSSVPQERNCFNLLVLKCVAITSCSKTPCAKGGRQLAAPPKSFLFFAGHCYALYMRLFCAVLLFRRPPHPLPPEELSALRLNTVCVCVFRSTFSTSPRFLFFCFPLHLALPRLRGN